MTNDTEKTSEGQRRKLLQPLHNHYLVMTEADTPDKHIETINSKG
jgi:hypothetical protein